MTVRAPFAALVGMVQLNGTFVFEPAKLSLSHVKSGIPRTSVEGKLVPMTVTLTLTTEAVLFVALRGESDVGFGAAIAAPHGTVAPPLDPVHDQFHGPVPVKLIALPALHKLAPDGAELNVCPLALPHTPLINGAGATALTITL